MGLISGGDETAYRDEIKHHVAWYSVNNLSLNTTKTKEIIIDFRRKCNVIPALLCINGVSMERVESFKFLGLLISEDLSWSANTSATIKRVQQRLYFLRLLRRNDTKMKMLVSFYWQPSRVC